MLRTRRSSVLLTLDPVAEFPSQTTGQTPRLQTAASAGYRWPRRWPKGFLSQAVGRGLARAALAGFVLGASMLASCRGRQAEPAADKSPVTPDQPAVRTPALSPVSPLGNATPKGPSVDRLTPEEVRSELAKVGARMSEVGQEAGNTYRQVADIQRQASSNDAELVALRVEVDALRQKVLDRVNAAPGMAEKLEQRTALQKEADDLLKKQRELYSQGKLSDAGSNVAKEATAVTGRLKEISQALATVNRDIISAKYRARAESPEIQSMSSNLMAKQSLLMSRLNALPEIGRLQKRQSELREETEALSRREAELKARAASPTNGLSKKVE